MVKEMYNFVLNTKNYVTYIKNTSKVKSYNEEKTKPFLSISIPVFYDIKVKCQT